MHILQYKTGIGSNPNAWNISSASYSLKSFDLNPRPAGHMIFQPNNENAFIIAFAFALYFYQMGLLYDVTTTSYQSTISLFGDITAGSINGIRYNNDGTIFYVGNAGNILEYVLSSPYDITSRTLSATNNTGLASFGDFYFNSTGTKMYAVRTTTVEEFILSVPFDTSTLLSSHVFDVTAAVGTAVGLNNIWFNTDGTKMFVSDNATGADLAREFVLSTAWDLSSASFNTSSIPLQSTAGTMITFTSNGAHMYVNDTVNDIIYQYDLG